MSVQVMRQTTATTTAQTPWAHICVLAKRDMSLASMI